MEKTWNSISFINMWKRYNDYLIEQFSLKLDDNEIEARLQNLKEISENDVDLAIKILRYLMACSDKTIYRPSDNQLSGEEPHNDDYELWRESFSIQTKTD